MTIQGMLSRYGVKVLVIRDEKLVLETKALISGEEITFSDVNIQVLDIIKVHSQNIEYRVNKVMPTFKGNKILYKKAKVEVL